MPGDRVSHLLLALIVAAFIGIGALYAALTPPWQAPDEPAHYNYIAQVAGEGCCPLIAPGDWDAAYLETLKASQFPEDADLSPIEYEDHQPPLYYFAGALIYRMSGGSLFALRMLSVVFGAGVVIAAYMVVAWLFPRHRPLALAVAALVAFVPQHVAIMASVNNDSLAELVLGVLLAAAAAYLGNPRTEQAGAPPAAPRRPHAAVLGGLAGLAFLTKLTIYGPAVLAVAAAILLRWRIERRPARWLAGQIGWAAGLALILGGLWWARNAAVYGWPDILAQSAHGAVVVGQLRTADLIAGVGAGPYLGQLLTTTYHSFWGQFGWMGVPMPPRVYLLIGLFLLADLAGLAILLLAYRQRLRLDPPQRAGLWMLGGVLLAALAQFAYYNLTFVQFQGRYLYPALLPLGLLVVGGLWGWALLAGRWLRGDRWQRALAWLPLLALAWLPLLALYALFRFVIPNLG